MNAIVGSGEHHQQGLPSDGHQEWLLQKLSALRYQL
jgi:hypothetical protein